VLEGNGDIGIRVVQEHVGAIIRCPSQWDGIRSYEAMFAQLRMPRAPGCLIGFLN
jgi:hypothetical protein